MARINSRFLFGLLALPIFMALVTCNARLYTQPPPHTQTAPEIEPQLRFLRQSLEDGSAYEMQALFPEGYFFSYALYGLSWVNIGLNAPQNSELRYQAL